MKRRFQQLDVFASGPFSGNPLAVVLDSEGLTTDEMQQFTRWMNLSETTFLLPPTDAKADYRVRIFTLDREMPFAGHPTLGSCHAWLRAGGRPRQSGILVQECGAGLVRIRQLDHGLAFAAPPLIRSGPVDAVLADRVAAVLGIEHAEIIDIEWADNGPGWVAVLLRDAEAVLALEPSSTDRDRLDIGIVGAYPAGSELAFEVRAVFTDEHGNLREDPVTGSLNASLAQWLLGNGRASAPYTARQGTRLGRAGRVEVSQDSEGTIWVGGQTTTRIEGFVEI